MLYASLVPVSSYCFSGSLMEQVRKETFLFNSQKMGSILALIKGPSNSFLWIFYPCINIYKGNLKGIAAGE